MKLQTTVYEGPDGPDPLLIAHGLFGSARNWGVLAKRLAADRSVVAVDMRNHGGSPRADTQSYADMAADLAETIADLPGGRADVLGHSMGGKAAMVLALERPDAIARLIVADIAPVAYGHADEQAMNIAAMRRVDPARVENRQDAAAAMGLDDPQIAAFFLQSLDMKARAWRLNLDVLEAEMGKIIGFPEVSGSFEGPTLFLSGGASSYVRRENRDWVKALFPAARFAAIPGAGHWLHAEKPREFEAAVATFLSA